MQSNQYKMADIQRKLHDSLNVIQTFEWLLDSYVLVNRNYTLFYGMKYLIIKIYFEFEGLLC